MVIQREEQILIKRRVLYIGSSVPLETTEGLEAVQQPLRDRYPIGDESQIQGIDTWIVVVPSGLQMQYVNDVNTIIQFPISSLTLCAAVRQVRTVNGATGEMTSKFVSLSTQQAGGANARNPAIFTAITRRTKGRRVLECHGFLCASDKDALELVKATKFIDANYKKNGTIRTQPKPIPQQNQPVRTEPVSMVTNGHIPNGTAPAVNGSARNSGVDHDVRLTVGETIENVRDAAPEFYDTVPQQGYFYSSANTEVKKFNIEKIGEKAYSDIGPTRTPRATMQRPQPPTVSARGIPPPGLIRPVPRVVGPGPPLPPQAMTLQRRPIMVPVRGGPMPPRPRFFSPPPMMRRPMYGPPPPVPLGMPPPSMMYGPPHAGPIFVRRPKPRAHSSGSRSGSSRESSPKNSPDETSPKHLPNGDLDSDSDISGYRPKTPPRDYDMNLEDKKRERLSRRDHYERGRRPDRSPHRSPRRLMYPGYPTAFIHPVYGPMFPAPYYGFGRSKSVPPPMRYPTNVKPTKKGKKSKKNKRKNRGAGSDISESIGGYNSEIPRGAYPPPGGYEQYPRQPRDFRREENQFLNEKSFSKSMQEQHRMSKGKPTEDYYPTAYELNDALVDDKPKESEFMY